MEDGKEFYTKSDIVSALEGMKWTVDLLLMHHRIRPEYVNGEMRLTPIQFKLFLMWRDYIRNLSIKVSEGHARRRNGLPTKSSLPKEYPPVKGFVYIIECGGRYKIGKTENLTTRFAHFSIILPFEPVVIHHINSDNISQTERELHVRYKTKRVRGEWFDLSHEDIEAIKLL